MKTSLIFTNAWPKTVSKRYFFKVNNKKCINTQLREIVALDTLSHYTLHYYSCTKAVDHLFTSL